MPSLPQLHSSSSSTFVQIARASLASNTRILPKPKVQSLFSRDKRLHDDDDDDDDDDHDWWDEEDDEGWGEDDWCDEEGGEEGDL